MHAIYGISVSHRSTIMMKVKVDDRQKDKQTEQKVYIHVCIDFQHILYSFLGILYPISNVMNNFFYTLLFNPSALIRWCWLLWLLCVWLKGYTNSRGSLALVICELDMYKKLLQNTPNKNTDILKPIYSSKGITSSIILYDWNTQIDSISNFTQGGMWWFFMPPDRMIRGILFLSCLSVCLFVCCQLKPSLYLLNHKR